VPGSRRSHPDGWQAEKDGCAASEARKVASVELASEKSEKESDVSAYMGRQLEGATNGVVCGWMGPLDGVLAPDVVEAIVMRVVRKCARDNSGLAESFVCNTGMNRVPRVSVAD